MLTNQFFYTLSILIPCALLLYGLNTQAVQRTMLLLMLLVSEVTLFTLSHARVQLPVVVPEELQLC